jgi:hypothetical protein
MRRHIIQLPLWVCLLCSSIAFAQAPPAQTVPDTVQSPWHHSVVAGLNLAQVGFSHWTQGGTDALTYIALLAGKSERDNQMTNWTTIYKFDFGQTKASGREIQNTDDEINLQSVFTYKIDAHINPYVSAALLTQFAPGYNYSDTGAAIQVSNFFDPAYIRQSAGIAYKQSEAFDTRLGIGLREIITDHFTQYTGDPTKKTKVEGGVESISDVQLEVDKNVLFRAKLDLFSPLEEMGRIVVHAEGGLVAKVSKFFSAEIDALAICDPDVSPYTQVKEGISIGITYVLL